LLLFRKKLRMPYVQVLVHVVGGGVDILLVMYIAFYRVSFHSFLLLLFLSLVFGDVWLFALWTLSNFRCWKKGSNSGLKAITSQIEAQILAEMNSKRAARKLTYYKTFSFFFFFFFFFFLFWLWTHTALQWVWIVEKSSRVILGFYWTKSF